MIQSDTITFNSQGETLIGTIDWNANKDKPTVLSIHGSRPGNREYIAYMTTYLAQNGFSCLRFDLSGHGESTGDLEAPVNQFIQDSITALNFMDTTKPLTIIGSSLGGPIAVELTAHASVGNLVLIAPSAYPEEALNVPYSIRSQWPLGKIQHTPQFDTLSKFTGNLLHIIGQNDTIIPANLTELYKQHSSQTAKIEFVTIPGCPHGVSLWMQEHKNEKQVFLQHILKFIS